MKSFPMTAISCETDQISQWTSNVRNGWKADAYVERGEGLRERVSALLLAPEGRRDWPLRFYSAERLFSKAARLGWVEPDLEIDCR